jgi:hypothetical protein
MVRSRTKIKMGSLGEFFVWEGDLGVEVDNGDGKAKFGTPFQG